VVASRGPGVACNRAIRPVAMPDPLSTLRYARGKGAKASRTFTGRGVAIVAPRSKTGGEFDVYVDGTRVKTVYLLSETYQARRVEYSKSWTSSGSHTITIVKKSANSGYPMFLDAILVLK
jgi:hypothetical protein